MTFVTTLMGFLFPYITVALALLYYDFLFVGTHVDFGEVAPHLSFFSSFFHIKKAVYPKNLRLN